MDDSQALLVVERGPTPALRFSLNSEQTTIGRGAGNELVLADQEVSRRHARVVRRVDGFAIEDIGSTNGTFINGQRINHLTLLQDGDTIDLGDTVRLRFLAANHPPATPPIAVTPELGYAKPVEDWQPPRPVNPPEAAYVPATPAWEIDPADLNLPPIPATPRASRGRLWILGCGLPVALILVCAGTFLLLDAYDQGRLLYCGALAPFFEVILGPFGFAPICP
jgi:hypothetical protein